MCEWALVVGSLGIVQRGHRQNPEQIKIYLCLRNGCQSTIYPLVDQSIMTHESYRPHLPFHIHPSTLDPGFLELKHGAIFITLSLAISALLLQVSADT